MFNCIYLFIVLSTSHCHEKGDSSHSSSSQFHGSISFSGVACKSVYFIFVVDVSILCFGFCLAYCKCWSIIFKGTIFKIWCSSTTTFGFFTCSSICTIISNGSLGGGNEGGESKEFHNQI